MACRLYLPRRAAAGPAARSWTIPSSIGVSGFGGESLFSLFNASIASNLAKFPTGPQLDDPFWYGQERKKGKETCSAGLMVPSGLVACWLFPGYCRAWPPVH